MEAKFLHTTSEFHSSLLGIVHGESSKSSKTIPRIFDLVVNVVIHFCCVLLGSGWVCDALNSWDGERHDGVTNPVLVGDLESFAGDRLNLAQVAVKILWSNVQSC